MKVSNIVTKVLGKEDGEVNFAIKALVENVDDDHSDAFVHIQGLDGDGFEIHSLYLEGTIPRGKNRELTTRDEVEEAIFGKIVKWQSQ